VGFFSVQERLSGSLPLLRDALLFSAALEFLLLRVAIRAGHAFPLWMRGTLYEALFFLGNVAFNIAFLLSIIILALLALSFAQRHLPLSILLSLMLASGIFILPFFHSEPVVLGYDILSLSVLCFASAIGIKELPPQKIRKGMKKALLLSLMITYLCTYYFKIGTSLSLMDVSLPYLPDIFSIGEAFALLSCLFMFFAFRKGFNVRFAAIASLAAIVFVALAFLLPFFPLITTWSLYFTLHLPLFLYALAVGCYVYAITDLARSREWMLFSALILIALGGRMLQLTYLVNLSTIGFLTLCGIRQ